MIFDVFAIDQPQDQELFDMPSFLATPQVGCNTHEAILVMGQAAIFGLDRIQTLEIGNDREPDECFYYLLGFQR